MRFRRLIDDYLNPEIKNLQRDLMDLGRAQIFSPPCFSFLLLLAACFLVALYQQCSTTRSILPKRGKTRQERRAEFGSCGGREQGLRKGWRHCGGKKPRQVNGGGRRIAPPFFFDEEKNIP